MPGTTSTALPSFSHDQHHKTDAAKRKGEMFSGKALGGQGDEIPLKLETFAKNYLLVFSFPSVFLVIFLTCTQ